MKIKTLIFTFFFAVNHSAPASLQVNKIGNAEDGKIGLWDDELSGDFDGLTIVQ